MSALPLAPPVDDRTKQCGVTGMEYSFRMLGAEIDLMPNEKMILASHPHWFYFWKQVAAGVGVLGLLLLLVLVDANWLNQIIGWVATVALIVLLLNLLYEFIQWKTTRFAITDQRVAYQSGMFRRKGVSIPLNRINNVNFHQSAIARVLNNGVVTIESAGETGDSVFENIPDPEHVRSIIFAQVEADEQADSDRDAAALAQVMQQHVPPPTGPAEKTPKERLAALEELRSQGLVNDDEFKQKRQQILDEI